MTKFLDILESVIAEQKRFKFTPELYTKMISLTDKLWSMRNKNFDKKTLVDQIEFKTSDGVDGLVKIVINPKLKFIGQMETKPKLSRDPMDFVMELQPKEYVSKKNLFLTIYHEMLHATDPTQSTKMNIDLMTSYNEKKDEMYWGHPYEFRAITNEFLEGLVLEFKRRLKRLKSQTSKKYLAESIDNILNYFAKNTPLSKLSLNIISRINDENVMDNKVSKIIADMPSEFPGVADFFDGSKEEPYYLTYIELIKKYNPEIWPRFLKMFYNTAEEIKDIIKNN
jgi:hypothetical protein